MPNLPPISSNRLAEIKNEIESLRRGGNRFHPKPHKLIMLLAVLDLIEKGGIKENKIYYSQTLISAFERRFREFSGLNDWCQPGPPFFHLRSASFWKHQIKSGRDENYQKLTTSGGGSKRILENIEYAYLDDDFYSILMNSSTYCAIKEQVVQILRELVDMPLKDRLSTVFHESFSLSRTAISQILQALTDDYQDEDLTSRATRIDFFRDHTRLGMSYVKSMPDYAKGVGFLDAYYSLTQFGRYANRYDPFLDHPGTQWLMHYHLSAAHGPGPQFWHHLVTGHFRSGDHFCDEVLIQEISAEFEAATGKPLSQRSARTTSTIFLGTYLKTDGLNQLGLLEKLDETTYRVRPPYEPPPIWAIAYALFDYLDAHFPSQATINLSDLHTSDGLTSQFMIGPTRLDLALEALQSAGMVDNYRLAPPYAVAVLKKDQEICLRRLYGLE